MTRSITIEQHAVSLAGTLGRRLVFQARRAGRRGDEESIHDLRVAIRRLSQCLRVFEQFLPSGRTRKTRRRMKRIMELAGEVRNRDIALQLLREAKVEDGELAVRLVQERRQAQRELSSELKAWRLKVR
ncbi:MAG: CHAD domain-containing protein [Bryobacterales bacterium]|nr:CHAD domain-containing protein [Bryobacterales bacterium]